MIELYEPLGRAMTLRQMMDRLMEEAFIMPREAQAMAPATAPLNVYEEGENLIVEAQLPGVKPEDIEITVEGGTLSIHGETKAEEERKERTYAIREIRRGSFTRSLRLPDTVDPDRVQVNFENGLLRLTFPKTAQAKARRIPVTAGGQQAQQGGGTQGAGQGGAG